MVSFSSSGVLAAGAGVISGFVGYYLHVEGLLQNRNPAAPLILMGGLGYCISVLTRSRAPLIVSISLAVTSLLTIICMSVLRSSARRNPFLQLASITIPLATGATFLVSNHYLNRTCAIGFVAGAIFADLLLKDSY